MKAGRELDVLIAEKVMGWTKDETFDFHSGNIIFWHTLDHEMIRVEDFNPSTDIADAWAVAEKFGLSVLKVDGGWQARRYVSIQDEMTPGADTAPLAICRAALASVGYKED